GGAESFTSTTLAVSTTYYFRVYHFGAGASNGNFTVCVTSPLPTCPTTFTPANNSIACATASATTLSWTAGANASSYNVYFNAGATPTVLVSTAQAALTYNAGVL